MSNKLNQKIYTTNVEERFTVSMKNNTCTFLDRKNSALTSAVDLGGSVIHIVESSESDRGITGNNHGKDGGVRSGTGGITFDTK